MQPDAHSNRGFSSGGSLGVPLGDREDNRTGAVESAHSVVVTSIGRPEGGHDSVSEVFVQSAVVLEDRARNSAVEFPKHREDGVCRLSFAYPCESDDVRKQDPQPVGSWFRPERCHARQGPPPCWVKSGMKGLPVPALPRRVATRDYGPCSRRQPILRQPIE